MSVTPCFLGIDLGTSSVKALLLDEKGSVLGLSQREYDIQKPNASWAEQDMALLWKATAETLQELTGTLPKEQIAGIGYSGQMHGLVMLDKRERLVRPAIIWADQRSQETINWISETIPDYRNTTFNSLSTGFLLASLVWMRENEPWNYAEIRRVMLPKDYIRYQMCGELGTDESDASGTAAFNLEKRQWDWPLIQRLNIEKSFFVPCHGSWEIAGHVTQSCAAETGLTAGIPVIYGGGDTLVQTVGNGVTDGLISNIGTASQLLCPVNRPLHDPAFRTNTFCHVTPGQWLLVGANLTGGAALKWLRNLLKMTNYEAMTDLALQVKPGAEGLIFLPYLNGERTPWNDPNARGILFGLGLEHGEKEIVRSVMEGIILAQRESLEIFTQMGLRFQKVVASGGGARSPVFRSIIASVLNCEVMTNQVQEQGCVGAAILAAVGTGAFSSLPEACSQLVRFDEDLTAPHAEWVERYNAVFEKFHALYPRNKELLSKKP